MVKLTKSELERRRKTESTDIGSYYNIGELVDKYGRDANIESEIECGEYGDDPEYSTMKVYINRMETDDEYNTRIETLKSFKIQDATEKKAWRKKKELEEKAEYERLKKKFGD